MRSRDIGAIAVAVLNAIASASVLLLNGDYGYTRAVALFSFGVFAVLCWVQRDNLLFLARTFILGFLGYFPMVIKVILGRDAAFNVFEPVSQGFHIVTLMYVTTSFALLSSHVGLTLGRRTVAGPPRGGSVSSATYWKVAFWCSLPLAVISAYVFIRGYGATVLTAGYASEEQGTGVSGAVNALGAMALFTMFVAGLKGHVPNWKVWFVPAVLLYVVYSQILVGARQDAMSLLFGLVILYGVVRASPVPLRMRYVPLLLVGYVFFEVWGYARGALATGDWQVVGLLAEAYSRMDHSEGVAFGTVSAISAPFANTLWLVDIGAVKHHLGLTYVEYILRIPPETLFPGRPLDYGHLSANHGLVSMGGFFELAEVYLNFGIAGALIMPGVLSFLLARAYSFAIARQTMFGYFLLYTFLAVFLRGTWYQTFAFFRTFTVAMLLYFGLLIVHALIVSRMSAPPRAQPA